jgi:hypothetical protein
MDGAALHAPGWAPAPPTRSAIARVLGVLGIVFGLLVAVQQVSCIALYGVAQQLQGAAASDPAVNRLLQVDMGLKGLVALLAVALVVIGVGLWRHREAARKALMVWSVLALVVVAGRTATEALVIQPETIKHQRALLARAGQDRGAETEAGLRATARVSIGLVPGLWAPFPIVALLLVSRRSVRDRCS